MNKEDIFQIVNLFSEHNLNRLSIKKKDFEIEIERGNEQVIKEVIEENANKSTGVSIEERKEKTQEEIKEENSNYKVKSPIVGVYYEGPSPESAAFVKEGDHVKQGDTICIIEAMKMINEISAPVSGVIRIIYYSNEDLVEYDDVLMEIKEDV